MSRYLLVKGFTIVADGNFEDADKAIQALGHLGEHSLFTEVHNLEDHVDRCRENSPVPVIAQEGQPTRYLFCTKGRGHEGMHGYPVWEIVNEVEWSD